MPDKKDSTIDEMRRLTCAANLPTADPAARMRLLRTLEWLGCAVSREGAYLLPDTQGNRRALTRLTDHIARNNGCVWVIRVIAPGESQTRTFRAFFDCSEKYDSLLNSVKGLKAGFSTSEPISIARVLARQRREFDAIPRSTSSHQNLATGLPMHCARQSQQSQR